MLSYEFVCWQEWRESGRSKMACESDLHMCLLKEIKKGKVLVLDLYFKVH